MDKLIKDKFRNIVLFVSIILSAIPILNLFRLANYGIDFSDEGFYLNWASYRYEYPTTTTYFGFLTGFIFDLLKEDIVNFRIFNICTSFILGLSAIFISYRTSLNKNLSNIDFSSVLLLATISFISFPFGFMTPSYNTLNFYGFCLISISLNFLKNKKDNHKLIFLTIYSIGFVLISLSKVTSVIPLILFTFIFLLLQRDLKLIFSLLVSTFIASLTAIYIFSGETPVDILQFVRRSIEFTQTLGSVHNADASLITRSISQIVSIEKKQIIYFLFFTAINIINICNLEFLKRRINLYIYFFTIPIYLSFFLILKEKSLNAFFLSVPISVLIIYIKDYLIMKKVINNLNLKLSLFNLMLPFAYHLGSGLNYWKVSQQASIFYICSSLFIFNSIRTEVKDFQLINNIKRFIFLFSLFSILLVNFYIEDFSNNPYRQADNLLSYKNKTEIAFSNSKLYISDEFSSLINEAREALVREGFKPRTPIMDMSGRHPGFIYSIKGMTFAHPWILGAYPGSNDFAKTILRDVPLEDFEDVWFLIEENGHRSLDYKNLLLDKNINIFDQSKYKKVFEKPITFFHKSRKVEYKSILNIYKPLKKST